jgi:hypothetical protein
VCLKDFDGRGREAQIDGLVNEPMRHGVQMALDVDVIVDVTRAWRHSVYTKRSVGSGPQGWLNRSAFLLKDMQCFGRR